MLSYLQRKASIEGLPTFGDKDLCTTLEITCCDKVLNLEVTLVYTAFENLDVITRSVRVKNNSDKVIKLEKVLSACVDFDGIDYDIISLHGSWARERRVQRMPVGLDKRSINSIRGESSHQSNPFIALMDKDANDDYGNVYGFNLVYSVNLQPLLKAGSLIPLVL